MKILYITQLRIDESTNKWIYWDLVKCLGDKGNNVTIVSGDHCEMGMAKNGMIDILKVKTAKQFGVSFIKKGLAFVGLPLKYIKVINKHLKKSTFDIILYEAPPVMLADVVAWCKRKFNAKTYLMLKDIFPQNALDLGILKKKGLKGFAYRFFKSKERKLYKVSDTIGCMSQGNIDYLVSKEKNLLEKCEILPNAIVPSERVLSEEKRNELLVKYNIDLDKTNFVYGGNLGKPQGLNELIAAINKCSQMEMVHFYLIGKGTEQDKVKKLCEQSKVATYFEYVPSDEYNNLMTLFDVGMVALDYRSTIPNYPSRVLSYMNTCKPILASTDSVTDFKELIRDKAKCGLWNEARDIDAFCANVEWFSKNKAESVEMGKNGHQYMLDNFSVEECANKILKA